MVTTGAPSAPRTFPRCWLIQTDNATLPLLFALSARRGRQYRTLAARRHRPGTPVHDPHAHDPGPPRPRGHNDRVRRWWATNGGGPHQLDNAGGGERRGDRSAAIAARVGSERAGPAVHRCDLVVRERGARCRRSGRGCLAIGRWGARGVWGSVRARQVDVTITRVARAALRADGPLDPSPKGSGEVVAFRRKRCSGGGGTPRGWSTRRCGRRPEFVFFPPV